MTKPGDFATSDDNGSLSVILRDTAGAYVAAGGGGGGGGGDASAANQVTGNASLAAIDTNAGATTDLAVTTNTTGTLSGKVRGLVKLLIDLIAKTPALGTAGTAATDVITVQGIASGTAQAISGTVTANAGTGTLAVSGPVTDTQLRATPVPVSGTVTANAGTGTLAISAATLPLPSGASTAAKQPALGTAGTASADVVSVQGIASMTALKVDGSAVTQPVSGTVTANAGTGTLAVSAASLPLPSGAATSAKQPALGTAGTAASDVITVQGIASGTAQPASQSGTWTVQPGNTANTTAWKVDGSAVTQPVSLNGGLPAALAAGGGLKVEGVAGGVAQPVTAGGYTVQSAFEIVRPADTTAYAAKDCISDSTSAPTVPTFANCARTSGGSGYVTKARMITDQAANTATYRLHLWGVTQANTNDNAIVTVPYANAADYLGFIDLPACTAYTGSSAATENADVRLPFVATGTSLFGKLETSSAFTPASGQKFHVQLGIEQN